MTRRRASARPTDSDSVRGVAAAAGACGAPARTGCRSSAGSSTTALRHSRINVIPLGNTVDPHERFAATLKFFRGGDQPVHTFISQPFAGDQIFRYESADLLTALGEPTFEGLVEITARSLDNPPEPLSVGRFVARVLRRRRLAERLGARASSSRAARPSG